MRIALLGPVGEETTRLEKAAATSLTTLSCHALYYLGEEPEVVEFLAQARRSFDDQGEAELWQACERCLTASADEIKQVVQSERRRQALLQVSLLGGGSRRLHPPSGARWLLCQSWESLADYDRRWPRVVVHADSERWAVSEENGQLVLSPGRSPRGGLMLLDDSPGPQHDTLSIAVYDEQEQRVTELAKSLDPSPRISES